VTYNPGNLTVTQHGLLLSQGLKSRVIAQQFQPVPYTNAKVSKADFYRDADAGATFRDPRRGNQGDWIYVSNSEVRSAVQPRGGGGAAITFDRMGNVLEYRTVLSNTTANCGGGRTPWGAWISCEEFLANGQIWQVDPTGKRKATKPIALGIDGGTF
jgi:secreted PhoX family phosphatase